MFCLLKLFLHNCFLIHNENFPLLQKTESTEAESLELDHLEGVFVIVWYGSLFAFVYGAFDAMRLIRKRAKQAKVSFWAELKLELRFMLKSLMNPNKPKPVRFVDGRQRSLHSSRSIRSRT